ncbi:hypothetical protein cand_011770 [Cryptosporidium andersoni]|uniref:Uncharacterized protein n=1 Tax=Cryptosporidium andersoni TaxID=117008 RepID=A0A1J4MEK4_9CRYT|nr:hypothetical protein cand_011770 [Cryptosporidium andersoni]
MKISCGIKAIEKNLVTLIITVYLIIPFTLSSRYDIESSNIARTIFSRPMSIFGNKSKKEVWDLADREIKRMEKDGILSPIYKYKGAREMYVSVEILGACERLLSRIESDSYSPVLIDEDAVLTGDITKQNKKILGYRVANEIQYCLLLYGTDILDIPALEKYADFLRSWGIPNIFTDKTAIEIVNEYTKDTLEQVDSKDLQQNPSLLKLLSAPRTGEYSKYVILDPNPKPIEKRKLVTMHPRQTKTVPSISTKPQEAMENIQRQKRIIARPKQKYRLIEPKKSDAEIAIKDEKLNNTPSALASRKITGKNILELASGKELSGLVKTLGPESQFLLAWQAVLEAKKKFENVSQYIVINLPSTIPTYVLYQAVPNFALSQFEEGCLTIIMYLNSQVRSGFLVGDEIQFFMKNSEIPIENRRVFKTAAELLCKIAVNDYLEVVLANAKEYIERLQNIQPSLDIVSQDETIPSPQDVSKKLDVNPPIPNIEKSLYDVYFQVLEYLGVTPLLPLQHNIWEKIKSCKTGKEVNELIYQSIDLWFVPTDVLTIIIMRIIEHHHFDNFIIMNPTEIPSNTVISNIFKPSENTIIKVCSEYIQKLINNNDLVIVDIVDEDSINELAHQICQEVVYQISQNEAILSNKDVLIRCLYNLEVGFCRVLNITPVMRSLEKADYLVLDKHPVLQDIWLIEDCTLVSSWELNYLLCFSGFAQAFISYWFPKANESQFPITLLCKAFIETKQSGNPFSATDYGDNLAKCFLDLSDTDSRPYIIKDPKEKHLTSKLFIEMCSQFEINHDSNFVVNPDNRIASLEFIHSQRHCPNPLYASLSFNPKLLPINDNLMKDLESYGCNQNIPINNEDFLRNSCIGLKPHFINYLTVLSATFELFLLENFDKSKLPLKNTEIELKHLCKWWRNPNINTFRNVFKDILPFMKDNEVSNYVFSIIQVAEFQFFQYTGLSNERIKRLYKNPMIRSNRAGDLPEGYKLPKFRPDIDVFTKLEPYLKKTIIHEYRELNIKFSSKTTLSDIKKVCKDILDWQANFIISFQNNVTKIISIIITSHRYLFEPKLPIIQLCQWVSETFSSSSKIDKISVNDVASNLEKFITQDMVIWMLPGMANYLITSFNIWIQSAYILKLGKDIAVKKPSFHEIFIEELKILFDTEVTPLIAIEESANIMSIDDLPLKTRIMLNPFVDPTFAIPRVDNEGSEFCIKQEVINLMNAYRVFLYEFQSKFISSNHKVEIDTDYFCITLSSYHSRLLELQDFTESEHYNLMESLKHQLFEDMRYISWIDNKSLFMSLIEEANSWILESYEIPRLSVTGISNLTSSNINLKNLFSIVYKRPILENISKDSSKLDSSMLPKINILTLNSESLKKIIPFLKCKDSISYYKEINTCSNLEDWEIRFLITISAYFEYVSEVSFNSEFNLDDNTHSFVKELQFEYSLDKLCNWWKTIKSKDIPHLYSVNECWASLLSKHFNMDSCELHNKKVKLKQWFIPEVAEAMLISFFRVLKLHNELGIFNQEFSDITLQDGTINQEKLRSYQIIKDIFKNPSGFKYMPYFHRSSTLPTNLPNSFFVYLHISKDTYLNIENYLLMANKRPKNRLNIKTGIYLHQSEINRLTLMAYVLSNESHLSITNGWYFSPEDLINLFGEYKVSEISVRNWSKYMTKAQRNNKINEATTIILYSHFLAFEARLINIDVNDPNLRAEAKKQLDEFYRSPIKFEQSFISNPQPGIFPLFGITKSKTFQPMNFPQIRKYFAGERLNFHRFQGHYWRSKVKKPSKNFFVEGEILKPRIWPIIGTLNNELIVTSKFNCNNLKSWRVNRATYWAGLLERYIHKGPLLIFDDINTLKILREAWGMPKTIRCCLRINNIETINSHHTTFNFFDMCYFMHFMDALYPKAAPQGQAPQGDNSKNMLPWEMNIDELPLYVIHPFFNLFNPYYEFLSLLHVATFFYEVVLEEKRIIKLKISKNDKSRESIYEKLSSIYHAPLFNEPKVVTYPGIFFEFNPPEPISWTDRDIPGADSLMPTLPYIESDDTIPIKILKVFGQDKSKVRIRDSKEILDTLKTLSQNPQMTSTFGINIDYYFKYISSESNFGYSSSSSNAPSTFPYSIYGFDYSSSNSPASCSLPADSLHWEHMEYTYTNGLDWFINYAGMFKLCTFISSYNLIRSITYELSNLIPNSNKNLEHILDYGVLASLWYKEPDPNWLWNNVNKRSIIDWLVIICQNYIVKKGILAYYESILENKKKLKFILNQTCSQFAKLWKNNFMFVDQLPRMLFALKFIYNIKYQDSSNTNLLYPEKPTDPIRVSWNLFLKVNEYDNYPFVGYYNSIKFWDPALVVNSMNIIAETKKFFFNKDFVEPVILQIAQTPFAELNTWFSLKYSPILKKEFFSLERINIYLEKSYQEYFGGIILNNVQMSQVTENLTVYEYCRAWVIDKLPDILNKSHMFCREVNNKFNYSNLLSISKNSRLAIAIEFFIYIVKHHPMHIQNIPLMSGNDLSIKIRRSDDIIHISKGISSLFGGKKKKYTYLQLKRMVDITENKVATYIFQRMSLKELEELEKNKKLVYSPYFYFSNTYLLNTFLRVLSYYGLTMDKKNLSFTILPNMSLNNIRNFCKNSISENISDISLLNSNANIKSDALRNFFVGNHIIGSQDIAEITKYICTTLIDEIFLNFKIYSDETLIKKFAESYISNIKDIRPLTISNGIFGWYNVFLIFNDWSKYLKIPINSELVNIMEAFSLMNSQTLKNWIESHGSSSFLYKPRLYLNPEIMADMFQNVAFILGYMLSFKLVPDYKIDYKMVKEDICKDFFDRVRNSIDICVHIGYQKNSYNRDEIDNATLDILKDEICSYMSVEYPYVFKLASDSGFREEKVNELISNILQLNSDVIASPYSFTKVPLEFLAEMEVKFNN